MRSERTSNRPWRRLLPLVFLPFFVGCWIEENTTWDNTLDPANVQYTRMVRIAGGTFQMGGDTTILPSGTIQGATEHQVTVSGFLMDSTEVTREDWNSLMKSNPSVLDGCPRCPQGNMTWFEAVLYCNARSKRQGLDTIYEWSGATIESNRVVKMETVRQVRSRNGYRLPSEAEWEYAARSGTSGAWPWGEDTLGYESHAWFLSNSHGVIQPVATLEPTGFGLYDLQGNVEEWVWDWWAVYSAKPQVDPPGPNQGDLRIYRGGSAGDPASGPKNGDRGASFPGATNEFIGFRCVRSLVP